MAAGSILFFIFRMQTSSHLFLTDVWYGGAKYIGTGRGFVLTHTPLITMFAAYGAHLQDQVLVLNLLSMCIHVCDACLHLCNADCRNWLGRWYQDGRAINAICNYCFG